MIEWQPNSRPRLSQQRLGKATVGTLMKVGISAVILSVIGPSRPAIVYNASASVPLGYYRVTDPWPLKAGNLVLLRTPPSVRQLADQRRYLPKTVPMIKHIAAMAGDTVCAQADRILINGQPSVKRLPKDSLGRAMPWWSGCHTLSIDEVFVLNPDAPQSFDGRYFGVVSIRLIVGKLRPL